MLISALLLGLALSFFVLFLSHRTRIEAVRAEAIAQMQSSVGSTVEVYGRLAEMAYDQTVHRPEIRELILQARDTREKEERARLRIDIAGRLEPVFSQLGYYQFRLLDLVLPDGTVFLRMHNPGLFGDKALPKSELRAQALENRMPVQGFQPGGAFSLYRYSFPLFLGDAFLGSAEFGLSSSAVAGQLKRQFPGYYTLLLRKDVLEPLLAPETRENYIPSSLSEKYYEDLQVRDLPNPLTDPDPEAQNQVLGKVRPEAAAAMEKGGNFAIFTRIGNGPYAVTFVEVASPGGKPLGYIVGINRNPRAMEIQQITLTVAILLAGLFFLSAAFLHQGLRHHEKLVREALYDSLTGGLKQGRFDDIASREVSMASRFNMPLSLMIFDLDHFKQVNDRWGHLKGDAVLRATGATVNRNIRRVDYFFRWGGDEFLLILPNTSLEGAANAAEKIRLLMEKLKPEGVEGISISAGVAQMEEADTDLRSVLKRADEALYRAKEKGRNNVST